MRWQLVGLLAACGSAVALAQAPAAPVRVGTQGVSQPRLVDVIKPAARFGTGAVLLEVTISPQGLVSDIRVLRTVIPFEYLRQPSGCYGLSSLNPESCMRDLERGVIDAVRQWRFEPTVINDTAVPVLATVTINS